jgi:hypothetical protein
MTQNTVDDRYYCVAEADGDHHADNDFVSITARASGVIGKSALLEACLRPSINPQSVAGAS